MKKQKSIIYANYSPYENSGKTLDFLLENFEMIFLFSVGFYNLKNKRRYNNLLIYKKGQLINQHLLLQIPVPRKLLFLLIPVRSFITFVQIVIYSFWIKSKYGSIETYFSVNAFTAWIGLILKKMGIVKKTVFWVWDYYPPIHDNKIIMLMRFIYWQFDRISSYSDRLIFVNKRLMDLRKSIGILARDADYPVVPIGTDIFPITPRKKPDSIVFTFIGVLKKSQGFGIVFDNALTIKKSFPHARFEVIGSGPDEEYFKNKAANSGIPTKFYGYLKGETFNDVLKKCNIGIATYLKDKSNVSYYGDPGKVKRYLSLGIPVIATDVFEFAHDIEKVKAGVIIYSDSPDEFINAIKNIMSDYENYSSNALNLSKKFYYKDIYPGLFSNNYKKLL